MHGAEVQYLSSSTADRRTKGCSAFSRSVVRQVVGPSADGPRRLRAHHSSVSKSFPYRPDVNINLLYRRYRSDSFSRMSQNSTHVVLFVGVVTGSPLTAWNATRVTEVPQQSAGTFFFRSRTIQETSDDVPRSSGGNSAARRRLFGASRSFQLFPQGVIKRAHWSCAAQQEDAARARRHHKPSYATGLVLIKSKIKRFYIT